MWTFLLFGFRCQFLDRLRCGISYIKLFQLANTPRHFTRSKNIALCFLFGFCQPPEAAITTKSAPLSASIVIVISLLDCLWRYRQAPGKQAPGWIISCSSTPDGHIAVTWRGNGKWHHYHSNTGTTFGVRAGFQRICHTTSHLPTGKTIMLTILATHSMDNYFI